MADEAAAIIGEFNEGYSNRQVWNSAALVAVGAWFGDDELVEASVSGRTGLLGLLTEGFGADGSWYEGENYHLFALRGLLQGLCWGRHAGADLLEDEELRRHLGLALLAPTASALPDFTFPARKDSRFGISLAQPMYLESWEVGRALAGPEAVGELDRWLATLYRIPAQPAETLDSYLHEAAEAPPATRTATDLSWWALLEMNPARPPADATWTARSVYLPSQGLAVLRPGGDYVSVECGGVGGGHGHADRLNLTLHAGGVYWLPDYGTGSYVTPDLFWYRSTMAHNAPLLNGQGQPAGEAQCEWFAADGDWSWVRAKFGECRRTVVVGPRYALDITEYAGAEARTLSLPWHLGGGVGDGISRGVDPIGRAPAAGPGRRALRGVRGGAARGAGAGGRGETPAAPDPKRTVPERGPRRALVRPAPAIPVRLG